MLHATQLDPNRHAQCSRASSVRAREHQVRAPQKCILGVRRRGSYRENVTVYPYNGHIADTNPIVRHVMSLTCTLIRMRASQHHTKRAITQPLHGSTTCAPATNLVASYIIPVGAHTRGSFSDCLPFGQRAHYRWQVQIQIEMLQYVSLL